MYRSVRVVHWTGLARHDQSVQELVGQKLVLNTFRHFLKIFFCFSIKIVRLDRARRVLLRKPLEQVPQRIGW